MNITYRELIRRMNDLSPERLDDNVTIYDESDDEYYPVQDTFFTDEDDVLDKGHLVLQIKNA